MKKVNLAVPIILTIVTLGLYNFIYLVWFQLEVTDQDTSIISVAKVFLATMFLSALTGGIWYLVVLYKAGGNLSLKTNTKSTFGAILCGLFGLFPIFTQFKINKFIDGYNKEY